jgi:hypothetical protein
VVTLAVLLVLALTLPAITALETKVLIVEEVNLTIDLDPPLAISNRSITEDKIQLVVIKNVEDPSAGNATIMIPSNSIPNRFKKTRSTDLLKVHGKCYDRSISNWR